MDRKVSEMTEIEKWQLLADKVADSRKRSIALSKRVSADLYEVGVNVEHLEDVDSSNLSDAAVEVLLKHVRDDNLDFSVRLSIVSVLKNSRSTRVFHALVSQYESVGSSPNLSAAGNHYIEQISLVIGHMAKKSDAATLRRLVRNRAYGSTRHALLKALSRRGMMSEASLFLELLDQKDVLDAVLTGLIKFKDARARDHAEAIRLEYVGRRGVDADIARLATKYLNVINTS